MADIQDYSRRPLPDFFRYLVETERLKATDMYAKALLSFSKTFGDSQPAIADLTEDNVRPWVDRLLIARSSETATRYLASLGKIYKHALTLGIATDNTLFTRLRTYAADLAAAGIDNTAQRYDNAVRTLATAPLTGSLAKAVDVVLYAIYNGGMPLDEVLLLRRDDDCLSPLPQAVALRRKYAADARKYVFPLQQWQQSVKALRAMLDRYFLAALQLCGVARQLAPTVDAATFVAEAWPAVAALSGVAVGDVCACRYGGDADAETQVRVRRQVANRVLDMDRHWYAVRFAGDDTLVRREITRCCGSDAVRFYYPIEEIYKKVGRRRVTACRPTIRHILFLQTCASTLATLRRDKVPEVHFAIIRRSPSDATFAIIPDSEMRRFSILVSNGLDILGDEAVSGPDITVGSYVRITDGLLKGYAGRVIKVSRKDHRRDTILQIAADAFGPEMQQVLGKHLNISVAEELVARAEVVK